MIHWWQFRCSDGLCLEYLGKLARYLAGLFLFSATRAAGRPRRPRISVEVNSDLTTCGTHGSTACVAMPMQWRRALGHDVYYPLTVPVSSIPRTSLAPLSNHCRHQRAGAGNFAANPCLSQTSKAASAPSISRVRASALSTSSASIRSPAVICPSSKRNTRYAGTVLASLTLRWLRPIARPLIK